MKKIDVCGFILEKEGDTILSICNTGQRVEIGQEVIANGRIFVPCGTRGRVVKISEPYKNGRTSDVIEVQFDGYESGHTFMMKLKDLKF